MSRGHGRWQIAILDQLEKSERILLFEFTRLTPGWKQLDRRGRHSRRVAVRTAAKLLEEEGKCRIVLEPLLDRRKRQQDHAVIHRPGIAPAVKVDAALVIEGPKPKFRLESLENVGNRYSPQLTASDEDTEQAAQAWMVEHYAFADPVNWAKRGSRGAAHVPEADYYEYFSDSFDSGEYDDSGELDVEPFSGPFEPTLDEYTQPIQETA